ncbi:MAG: hypothetical protein OEW67_12385 [Cyclobacteriaceae bacterium]|nr:hypothetical protein [Cyclobacteriaceae bacterium]
MASSKIDKLFKEYTQKRNLDINKEQFIYLVNLMPACLVAMSDGIMDHDEWETVKSLTKILGEEFATEDLGTEKEENLMLIYRGEMRYLIKHKEEWQDKFMEALKDYFIENDAAKGFIEETIELFEKGDNPPEVLKLKSQLEI